MKILISTLLLGALGVGSFQLYGAEAATPSPAVPDGCNATVTCTPQGTCRITCEDENGASCSIEIECDGEECRIVDCDGPESCPPECVSSCIPDCPPCCPGD